MSNNQAPSATLFTARHRSIGQETVVADVVAAAGEAVSGAHSLLIGASGSGKTFALAAIRHQLLDSTAGRCVVSELTTPPATITSWPRFVAAVTRCLNNNPCVLDEGVSAARRVLLIDDFDDIFEALLTAPDVVTHKGSVSAPDMLWEWLKSPDTPHVVGTSRHAPASLFRAQAAVHRVFQHHHLGPLTSEQGQELIDKYLAALGHLHESHSEQRGVSSTDCAVVEHLLGSTAGIWAHLAHHVTMEPFGDLASRLRYVVAQHSAVVANDFARLSRHQRLLVCELALSDRPLHVAGLAAAMDVDQRSVGKTVSDLVELGWLERYSAKLVTTMDKRRSYYQLTNPMVRQVVRLQAGKVAELAQSAVFLSSWWDDNSVRHHPVVPLREYSDWATPTAAGRVGVSPAQSPSARVFDAAAIEFLGVVEDALAGLQGGNFDLFLGLPSAVQSAFELSAKGAGVPAGEVIQELRSAVHQQAVLLNPQDAVRYAAAWQVRAEAWVELCGQGGESGSAVQEARVWQVVWAARSQDFVGAAELVDALAVELGPQHPFTVCAQAGVANGRFSAGQCGAAAMLFEQVWQSSCAVFGDTHEVSLIVANNLAFSQLASNQISAAATSFERLHTMVTHTCGNDSGLTLLVGFNTCIALLLNDQVSAALALADAGARTCQQVFGPVHRDTLWSAHNRAQAHYVAGDIRSATSWLVQVLQLRLVTLSAPYAGGLATIAALEQCLAQSGVNDHVRLQLRQVYLGFCRTLGPGHPESVAVSEVLRTIETPSQLVVDLAETSSTV